MYLLYVHYVDGQDRMVSVDATGSYFDLAQVIWDERTQGPMPQAYLNAYNEVLATDAAVKAAAAQAKLNAYNATVSKLLALGLTQDEINLLIPSP